MPVTAKLSRAFYDQLGDAIANELVEWFNGVDATYRADLRELNELNFARFDAKLEQRMAALEAKLEQRMAALEAKLEQRMVALEARLEQRVVGVEAKLVQLEARVSARLGLLEGKIESSAAATSARLVKWMFVFWTGTAVVVVGAVLGLVPLLVR